jgi:hypothetical protein
MLSFAITYGEFRDYLWYAECHYAECRDAFPWPERPVAIHKVIVADS